VARQVGIVIKELTVPATGTATSKVPTVSEIEQGPADLWLIGTAPTNAAVTLTLHTDLTPNSTTHPSSLYLGGTVGPVTLTLTPKLDPIRVDQADAPVDFYCGGLEAKIEAELTQSAMDKLTQALGLLATEAYSADTGYEQLGIGGLQNPAQVCVAVIAKKRSDATKVWAACLYKVHSVDGIVIARSRGKAGTYKVTFSGLADLARTAGKQTGVFYETV
jgi:hypothetical protein